MRPKSIRFRSYFLIDFESRKGCQKGRQNGSKSISKQYEIEVDLQEQTKVVPSPSWGRLEAILRHLGSHLGLQKDHFLLEFIVFRENRRF